MQFIASAVLGEEGRGEDCRGDGGSSGAVECDHKGG